VAVVVVVVAQQPAAESALAVAAAEEEELKPQFDPAPDQTAVEYQLLQSLP
jgi:hypothetical protein